MLGSGERVLPEPGVRDDLGGGVLGNLSPALVEHLAGPGAMVVPEVMVAMLGLVQLEDGGLDSGGSAGTLVHRCGSWTLAAPWGSRPA